MVDMLEEAVHFDAEGRTLEGILAYPEMTAPTHAVLLLSPHPHMGGRMDNNVITHLAHAFVAQGAATLRFNYGGVGASERPLPEGRSLFNYWSDLEATKNYAAVLPDARAARDFLAQALSPNLPMAYVGYSFGCCLALFLALETPPSHLALVSPPVREFHLDGLDQVDVPLAVVAGDKDFVFDRGLLEELIGADRCEAVFTELSDCDHFYRKQEGRVMTAIAPIFNSGEAP